MRIAIWLLAHLSVVGGLCAQTDTLCQHHLSGQVIDTHSGEPVPFATINVLGTDRGTMADENGFYRLEGLCDQIYTLVCSHISCHHLEQDIHPGQVQHHDFQLAETSVYLATITVQETALRPMATSSEVTQNANALGAARGMGIAESLRHLARLHVVKSGGVDGKPVIQGLRGERVLLVNDGVRMEGQQWGDDHAPPLDPFAAEEIRVVHGAAGVAYGAGALGGVIIIDPPALPTETGVRGVVQTSLFSNGRMGILNGQVEGRLTRLPLSWRVRATLRRGGNLRTPDYFLNNTGLASYDLGYSLGYDLGTWQSRFRYETRRSRNGIFAGSHIGNLTDLEQAIARGRPLGDGQFSYALARPQGRVFHETAQWDNTYRTEKMGQFKLSLSRQFNRRQEFDAHRRFDDLPNELKEPEIEFELTAYQANARWEHPLWKNLKGGPGVQVRNARNTTDRGALLPDYTARTAGVYWIERWRAPASSFALEGGLRYDHQWLSVEDLASGVSVSDQRYANVSTSVGMVYYWSKQVQVRAHFGTAYRPPHPNELYSDGVHHGAASYERGDPNLQAERAQQFDVGIQIDQGDRWQLEASVYQQSIRDFIFLEPQAEAVLTIRGAFPAFRYAQADARLRGADLNLQYQLTPRWQLSGGASLLRARNLDRNEWLSLMPADRFTLGGRFYLGKPQQQEHYIGLRAQHRTEQRRVPLNDDFAAAPAAYTLLELEAATTVAFGKQRLQVQLQVFNLANARYRDYLDRFRYFSDASGRNMALSIRLPLD